MNLWLDDIRKPWTHGADGWTWAKTAEDAIKWLKTGEVECASLDHDLGACPACLGGRTPEQWLEAHAYQSMPHCSHFGTGYDVVCWMEENGVWPSGGVRVHSANPVGRQRMQQVIDRHYREAA